MITTKHIEILFDELWPGMIYVQNHKYNCINQLESITNYFEKFKNNHDELLHHLCSLEGIGITIASGLIWSVYPSRRVPFDKYTLTHALNLKIINTQRISKNYISNCDKIKKYCNQFVINNKPFTIKDFVREAIDELQYSDFLIEPI